MIFRPQCKCTRAEPHSEKIIRSQKWIHRKWEQTARVKAGTLFLLWEFSIFIFVDSAEIIGAPPCPLSGNAHAAHSSVAWQYFIEAGSVLGAAQRWQQESDWCQREDELSAQPELGLLCGGSGLPVLPRSARHVAASIPAEQPPSSLQGPSSPALSQQLWSKAAVRGRRGAGWVRFLWVLSHTSYFQLVSHASLPWVL